MRKRRSLLVALSLLSSLASASPTYATDKDLLTEDMRNILEQTFPGATIKNVEMEKWQGMDVTEVELTAKNGTCYEVYISSDGTIQQIEEEDDWW